MSEDSQHSDSHQGIGLIQICPNLVKEMIRMLEKQYELDVAQQLEKTVVIYQQLSGDASEFSFMAYPMPRLTTQERMRLTLVGSRSLEVIIDQGCVQIDLDDFGKINWFYIYGIPQLYESMCAAMQSGCRGTST